MKYFILISLFCAGCCSCASKNSAEQRRVQQPEAIFLGPRTPVKQNDGSVYISGDVVEIWHSEKTVERLERDLARFNPQP
jgi:hypothetical protein